MGIQWIGSQIGYVVDFDKMPNLPITGVGIEQPYAEALTDAILKKIVKEPGKYFIVIGYNNTGTYYEIAKIIE